VFCKVDLQKGHHQIPVNLEDVQRTCRGSSAGVEDIHGSRMVANQASCPSTVQVEGASMLCDVADGITRPLVPLADRPAVFHAIHSVAHPGIRATKHGRV
jgi:hypothetical protein